MSRLVRVAGAALGMGAIIAGTIVGGGYAYKALRDRAENLHVPAPKASVEAAREARLASVIGEVAPAPLPTGFPLLGPEGRDQDGYPTRYVDRTALRSLLWHKRYAELSADFMKAQKAFEADPRKEYWVLDCAQAFDSAEPQLGTLLDAWVAADPQSFAAHLARSFHHIAVAFESRGGAFANETAKEDMTAMQHAFVEAQADVDATLALYPGLMAARRAQQRCALSSKSGPTAEDVFRVAAKECPTCFQIRASYMVPLQPRWGGSYAKMAAFARQEIAAGASKNPRFLRLATAVMEDQADLARIAKNYDGALAILSTAFALHPQAPLATRSSIYFHKNDYIHAAEDADAALRDRPQDPSLLLRRARGRIELGKIEQAAEDALLALRCAPNESGGAWVRDHAVYALYTKAKAEQEAGQQADAIRLSELALQLAPLDHAVHHLHIQAVIGPDRKKPGLEAELRARLRANPDDVRSVQALDYYLMMDRKFDLILPLWDDYIRRHPDDGLAYLERSGTEHNLGQHEKSRADARKSCELGYNEACQYAK